MINTRIEKERTVEWKGNKTVMRSRVAGQGRSPGVIPLGGKKGDAIDFGGPIRGQKGEGASSCRWLDHCSIVELCTY